MSLLPQEHNTQLQVLEIGDSIGSTYAARLLADHGADVIKIETPAGDELRRREPLLPQSADHDRPMGGLFFALNTGKRSLCMDFLDPSDQMLLHRLLSRTDILILSLTNADATLLNLFPDALLADYPDLVTLSITPFGRTGPYADFQANELILANAGGWANLCPATHTDPALPPLKVFGDQCQLMSGIAGAMSALAHQRAVAQGAAGEYIDLSVQEYVASVLEIAIPACSYKGNVVTRCHQRSLIPWRIFQAQDAPVFIVCVEQDQWERLVEFMGHPDWAELDVFADQPSRAENQDLVHDFVQEFVSQWQAMDFYHAAQKHRVCVAPVLDLSQLSANEHLRARQFFQSVPVSDDDDAQTIECLGTATLTTQGRAAIPRYAPALNEHGDEIRRNFAGTKDRSRSTHDKPSPTSAQRSPAQQPPLPLEGIRVLDLTWAWAGPFCTLNLAHLGAQVVRLESSTRPDLYRRLPVWADDVEPGLNRSGMFNQWNQGKLSVDLDLSKPEGIALVKSLVADSDVVVQNFATGVMDRLGLGYDVLNEINPRVILCSISGYGQSGPYRQYMGYGPAIPPLTGLSAATGYRGGDPEEIGLSMPDPTAGITGAWAVVAALHRRDTTGTGEHLDVTLWEATGVLNLEGWMQYVLTGTQPDRLGNRSIHAAPHGVFACEGDDAWVAIACETDAQWQALAKLIDPALADDGRYQSTQDRLLHQDELEDLLGNWASQRDRWAIAKQLQAAGVPAFPTLTSKDIVEDEHLNERHFIERLEHPEVGRKAHAGIPWRLARRPNGVTKPAPCIGADNERVLKEMFGYEDQQIQQLYSQGVLN